MIRRWQWLNQRMFRKYRETLDQCPLAAVMPLDLARQAASFDKLVRDFEQLCAMAM